MPTTRGTKSLRHRAFVLGKVTCQKVLNHLVRNKSFFVFLKLARINTQNIGAIFKNINQKSQGVSCNKTINIAYNSVMPAERLLEVPLTEVKKTTWGVGGR